MLDRFYKITAIVAGIAIIVSAVVGPTIAGIYWLTRLEADVTKLQEDVADLQNHVAELQSDVAGLQSDVTGLQRGQTVMLDILRTLADEMPEVRADLDSHIHNEDGLAQFVGPGR